MFDLIIFNANGPFYRFVRECEWMMEIWVWTEGGTVIHVNDENDGEGNFAWVGLEKFYCNYGFAVPPPSTLTHCPSFTASIHLLLTTSENL